MQQSQCQHGQIAAPMQSVGDYPMWLVNVSNVSKWFINTTNKYQIMIGVMRHTWIIYIAFFACIQLESTVKASV